MALPTKINYGFVINVLSTEDSNVCTIWCIYLAMKIMRLEALCFVLSTEDGTEIYTTVVAFKLFLDEDISPKFMQLVLLPSTRLSAIKSFVMDMVYLKLD